MKKKMSWIGLGLFVFLMAIGESNADQTLVASKVTQEPVIDGVANDKIWTQTQAITTHDNVADIDLVLKAVYTDKKIFFLVMFPDKDKSAEHKMWTWNKQKKEYETGKKREDTFVFKWNMETEPIDLSVFANNPYSADIWYWKACRTDPVGYADDKFQHLGTKPSKKAKEVFSKSGKKMYLQRLGDSGKSSYRSKTIIDYLGDNVPNHKTRQPEGSRADIKAKGIWKDGQWTIEFGRLLVTGNGDDIPFDIKQSYQFGVSRHEIAGLEEDPEAEQPKFGMGDISENLTLKFSH